MKARRESNGRKRIRQERREKEIQIDFLQREMARERGFSKTQPQESMPKSVPKLVPPRITPSLIPHPTMEKKPENRVMEWIRECEKPVVLDLMDDELRTKTSGTYLPFQLND
jgi:hypothetical protein